jgi:hypothetical protein
MRPFAETWLCVDPLRPGPFVNGERVYALPVEGNVLEVTREQRVAYLGRVVPIDDREALEEWLDE